MPCINTFPFNPDNYNVLSDVPSEAELTSKGLVFSAFGVLPVFNRQRIYDFFDVNITEIRYSAGNIPSRPKNAVDYNQDPTESEEYATLNECSGGVSIGQSELCREENKLLRKEEQGCFDVLKNEYKEKIKSNGICCRDANRFYFETIRYPALEVSSPGGESLRSARHALLFGLFPSYPSISPIPGAGPHKTVKSFVGAPSPYCPPRTVAPLGKIKNIYSTELFGEANYSIEDSIDKGRVVKESGKKLKEAIHTGHLPDFSKLLQYEIERCQDATSPFYTSASMIVNSFVVSFLGIKRCIEHYREYNSQLSSKGQTYQNSINILQYERVFDKDDKKRHFDCLEVASKTEDGSGTGSVKPPKQEDAEGNQQGGSSQEQKPPRTRS